MPQTDVTQIPEYITHSSGMSYISSHSQYPVCILNQENVGNRNKNKCTYDMIIDIIIGSIIQDEPNITNKSSSSEILHNLSPEFLLFNTIKLKFVGIILYLK